VFQRSELMLYPYVFIGKVSVGVVFPL